jgi:ATP-dependent 26S proteasome regulatory subunit
MTTEQTMIEAHKTREDDGSQQLTLSGVLNFIDGLWSACGGERIFVFTTNKKDQLDPALIRRGRMDMHIEMSYCSYEAFKVLANNYLEIDDHQLFERFGKIQQLLEVAKMSPADVAEHLMRTENDAGACLEGLVLALQEKAAAAKKELEKYIRGQGGSRS